MNLYHPSNDGITHINLYSKGKTKLGQLLSNFAHTPFISPLYGQFASLEGFWYWLATGQCIDRLRTLYGYAAKKEGQAYLRVNCLEFETIICHATEWKLYCHPEIVEAMQKTNLPFVHYYVFGDTNTSQFKQQFSTANAFQIEYLELLRYQLMGD
jgi:hypothetical protein